MPTVLTARDIMTLASSGEGARLVKALLDQLTDLSNELRAKVNTLTLSLHTQFSKAANDITGLRFVSESLGAPPTASTTAVHAAFAGNDASNNFPGAFTNPTVPRNLTVTFAASWDGGNVSVTGVDQFGAAVTEVFTANPGATVTGSKIFATATSATKGAVGSASDAASIGTGNKLGLTADLSENVGILATNGLTEAATWDATYSGVTPTNAPNGSRTYSVIYNTPATAIPATIYHLDYAATEMDTLEAVPYANSVDTTTIWALANALKTAYNAHLADAAAAGDNATYVHAAADATNTASSATATDLASSYTLLNEIKADFNAHLSQAGVHYNNDANTVATTNASSASTAVALANDLKDALLAHARSAVVIRAVSAD